MDKKMKQNFLLVAFGIILFAAVMNLKEVLSFLENIVGIFFPLLIGVILAFILSVPMNGIKRILIKAFSRTRLKPGDKVLDFLSLILTICLIILVGVLVGTVAIPQIVDSVKSIGYMLKEKWPEWAAVLRSYNIDTTPVTDWMENLNLASIVSKFLSGAGVVIDKLAGTAASTISVITTGAISIVVMFYVLVSRKDLERHTKKVLYAYLKKEIADKIVYVAGMIRTVYTKFLSGQFVEALILGTLMFIAFLIFRLPYAGLVAMLTAVCSFIPYIGAFFSCGIVVLLTLIVNPIQAIVCFIVYQVVQFIENQFIYPHVVGSSVGLSPLWTLMAVIIGGKLFGLLGMIFFIPLVAVFYTLFRESVYKRINRKNIKID